MKKYLSILAAALIGGMTPAAALELTFTCATPDAIAVED